MKKLLLLAWCMILSYTYSNAQINVIVTSPPAVSGSYDFTWADPAGGWGTKDLNDPANAIEDTLMLVDDGTADDSLGCGALVNNLTGKIAVVYRGTCEFGTKALNAQNAGAIGIIIINNVGGAPVGMAPGGDGAQDTIPTVMISSDDGAALRAELDAGSAVVAFIGNKAGFYNHDLGMAAMDVLTARATANPSLVSVSATEFNVPLGAWVYNYGNSDQSNVTLTATFTGADNYSATSTLVDTIKTGDSVYFSITAYSAPSYSGLYHINYIVNADSADDFISDNAFYANFLIDSLISYASIDTLTEMPVSSAHFRPSSSPTIYQSCIHFRDANASRLSAMGVYTSGAGGSGTPATMLGEFLEARIYEWNNPFTGLSDVNFPASPWALTQVNTGVYTYPADLQNEMIYIPFNETMDLVDNQRYLFCVLTYNQDVFLGFDSYYDYDEVINEFDQPISIVISDNNETALGFGTDISSSVSVRIGPSSTLLSGSISPINTCIGCDGEATVTAIQGVPPYTYLWSTGATGTTVTGLCDSTYTVSITDASGYSVVKTVVITPEPPASASITPSNDTTVCGSINLNASQGVSYLWSTGETTQQIAITASDSITVTVINVCGDSAVSAAIIINVDSLPPTPTITASGNTMTSSAATGNQWYRNDTIITIGGSNQTLVTTNPGSYTVFVTDSITGCVSLPSNTWVISGINEISASLMFNIYPNPNNGQFIVEFSNGKRDEALVEVRDLIGQLIYAEEVDKISGEFLKIDLAGHNQGVYFLSISNSSGTSTEKLIVY